MDYFKAISNLIDPVFHTANMALIGYSAAAGITHLAVGGLYKEFYFLGFLGAYPVSAFMVAILVYLFDREDPRIAIPYMFVWQSLANLLPLPTELLNISKVHMEQGTAFQITEISLAKTLGSLAYESAFLFIGLGVLKVLHRLPKPKLTKEGYLLGAALAFGCLGDSYHGFSTVLSYWLLITSSRVFRSRPPLNEDRAESPYRNEGPGPAKPE